MKEPVSEDAHRGLYCILDLFNGWIVLPLLKLACRAYDWLTDLHSRIDRITAPPPF